MSFLTIASQIFVNFSLLPKELLLTSHLFEKEKAGI